MIWVLGHSQWIQRWSSQQSTAIKTTSLQLINIDCVLMDRVKIVKILVSDWECDVKKGLRVAVVLPAVASGHVRGSYPLRAILMELQRPTGVFAGRGDGLWLRVIRAMYWCVLELFRGCVGGLCPPAVCLVFCCRTKQPTNQTRFASKSEWDAVVFYWRKEECLCWLNQFFAKLLFEICFKSCKPFFDRN